jgi:hypothetical protein
MNGNTKLGNGSKSVAINKDISSAFALDVSGATILRNTLYVASDLSLGANFFVIGDSSLNSKVSVGGDLSLNGNLYVTKRSVFTGDVSMNGNTRLGTGSQSVAINKDISSAFALDVSGVTQIRGNLDVAGVFTVNGAPVSGGGTLTGNVQVGSNNGFVTIDKPQFYSDPSLTIYYDFDSASYNISPNDVNTIINKGNGGSGFTATLQGSNLNAMIDTSEKKWGTASLKQNTAVSNDGITINSTIPVSNTFSVSLWVKKSGNTTIDRLFEFSNVASGTSENETIALNVNTSGKLVPIVTNGTGSAVTLSNNYIFDYNIGNNIWNNIVWILASGKSFIYINGTICQIDTVNTITNLTNRTYGFIARTNNTTGYAIENANIDDFRYYKDKALSYAEIYQLYNNSFYTLDICGGFLANGSSIIYEPSGSVATANSGSLTLLHGDASGSSSIMFKSVNSANDYAYVQYTDNNTVPYIKSFYKWNLSPGSNITCGLSTTVDRSVGSNTTATLSTSPHTTVFSVLAPSPPSTFPSNTYCISFNQLNQTGLPGTGTIDYIQGGVAAMQQNITISFWIRPNITWDTTNNGNYYSYYLAHFSNSGTNVIDIYIRGSDQKLFVLINNSTANFKVSNSAITNNVWTHVAFTYSASPNNGYIYINGVRDEVSQGSGYTTLGALNAYNSLLIGARWDSINGANYRKGFRGYMNFINIFNQTLSDSNITYLYDNPSYGQTTGLMTIGIEDDAGSDRISLFASGGTGFVGVNTKTPQYSLDVSGQMRIYEGVGTAASATNGSLTLEHANAGGASSLVFKGPNSTTSDYAYIEYDDNVYSAQSLYKWNLSPGAENTYTPASGTNTVDTSVGLNKSVTLIAQAAQFFSVRDPSQPSSNTYCISFNQTNQIGDPGTGNISYLQSGTISMSKTNITISFWIRPNITYDPYYSGGTYYRYYIAHFSNGNSVGVIDMYIRGNDQKLFVLFNDNGTNYKTTNSSIQSNVWTHVAFTFSPNNGFIYINGVKDEFTAGTGYTSFTSLNAYNAILFGMRWGANTGNNYNKGFRGHMNYINVFDKTLSDSDIKYLYDNPSYSSTTDRGLMTIGIENDGGINNDCIALWPDGGTGFVGVNTKTPQATLDVSGSLNVSGNVKIFGDVEAVSYNAISDYRMKENVVPLDDSFTIDGLNPVTYNLKSSCKKDIGFIAHEVQEFYTFLVSGEKDGKKTQSLNYNGFIGILTKEIQVLKKKVAEQEARIVEQSARIVKQEARIVEQSARIVKQEAKALEQSAKALEQSAKALEQEARISDQDQRIQALEKMVFDLINK